MVQSITRGIHVSIETEFQPEYSSPIQFHYVFTYKVVIENKGDQTVQLLRRQWFIHDAGFEIKEVEGEGVIGQPTYLRTWTKTYLCFWMQFKVTIWQKCMVIILWKEC